MKWNEYVLLFMLWVVAPLIFFSLWYSLLAMVTNDGDVVKALKRLFKRNSK